MSTFYGSTFEYYLSIFLHLSLAYGLPSVNYEQDEIKYHCS